jgi:hypothetical protein
MTESTASCRRREPTEAEKQARAERQAERLVLAALSKIASKTGLPRYQVTSLFLRLITSEREERLA